MNQDYATFQDGGSKGEQEKNCKSCDGLCEPTCSFCRQLADQAYQNEILENGY